MMIIVFVREGLRFECGQLAMTTCLRWWGWGITRPNDIACPFHRRRTAALENLRSNCIVRDSGGHSQRYWRLLCSVCIYILLFSLAPGKQLVLYCMYARRCVPYSCSHRASSRNFACAPDYIILKCLVTATTLSSRYVQYIIMKMFGVPRSITRRFPRGLSIRTFRFGAFLVFEFFSPSR